ncbi:hypothetical protein SASPL_131302 [Salvia splendens]|uniref:Uncharacterized protein n=1 Tax=Salvia splendens TaxID=180675 RepID=A0A8X8ZKH4_SALSN|nr:hypothetical protein SASPL_131302 [Salvia splendens]
MSGKGLLRRVFRFKVGQVLFPHAILALISLDFARGPLVEAGGGRVRFKVEMNLGETTIVSRKNLLKKANLSEADGPGPSPPGPSLEARGGAIAEPPTPLCGSFSYE